MKSGTLIKIITLLFSSSTALAVSLAYDSNYDQPERSLSTVSCSDGANGLETRGFTTLSSLPNFPLIGAAQAVAGWNSPDCGTCWQVTYTNTSGHARAINILAVDHAGTGFNIAEAAMNELTNGQAVQLGRINVTSEQVSASACGL